MQEYLELVNQRMNDTFDHTSWQANDDSFYKKNTILKTFSKIDISCKPVSLAQISDHYQNSNAHLNHVAQATIFSQDQFKSSKKKLIKSRTVNHRLQKLSNSKNVSNRRCANLFMCKLDDKKNKKLKTHDGYLQPMLNHKKTNLSMMKKDISVSTTLQGKCNIWHKQTSMCSSSKEKPDIHEKGNSCYCVNMVNVATLISKGERGCREQNVKCDNSDTSSGFHSDGNIEEMQACVSLV